MKKNLFRRLLLTKQENYGLVDTITLTDLPPTNRPTTLQAPNLTFPFRIVAKVNLKGWQTVTTSVSYEITIRKESGVLYTGYSVSLSRNHFVNPERTRIGIGIGTSGVTDYRFDDCDYFYIDQTFININTVEISIWGHLNKEDTPRLLKDKTLLNSRPDDDNKYNTLDSIRLRPPSGISLKEITFYIFQI